MTPVALRPVNDVSYVMRTKLARLDRDTCCSAHCK